MQRVGVNVRPDRRATEISFSQNDVGRSVVIDVYDEDGLYTIPTGATVQFKGTKPSGLGFTVSCVFSGSAVTLTATAEMTDEACKVPAELVITSGGKVIGTANFSLWVERNPHPEGTTDGQAEVIVPALTALIERAETAAEGAIDSAAEAKRQADRAFSGTPEGYSDLVQSVTDIFNIYGSKNLLQPLNPGSYTVAGITYAVADDGSVTANGTATALSKFTVGTINATQGSYKWTGVNGGAFDTYRMNMFRSSNLASPVYSLATGEREIQLEKESYTVMIYVSSGKTVNNVKFYPMLRVASVADSSYQPYAPTNQDLAPALMSTPTLNYGTLTSNFSFKAGGVATLSLGINGVSITPSGTYQNVVLCTLPAGYASRGETYVTVYSQATDKNYIGWVSTNGQVRFRLTDTLTNTPLRVLGTYLTA